MGIIVQFPAGHRPGDGGRYVDANAEPASVIILPVVRIERNPDQPSDGLDGGNAGSVGTAAPAALVTVSGARRLPRLAVVAFAVSSSALLSGCGTYGDFGRVRPSLVSDDIHAWEGPAAARTIGSNNAWRHQLTDEERMLRDLAYPLIEPPYDRQTWYSVLGELGIGSRPWPYPDRAAYASRLFTTAYRSQTARYNRLMEDIRNDTMRIDPFFASARYVLDMDRKRQQALGYVSGLTAEERDNTLARIAENRNIVRWVRGSLAERAASYRVALERMVIAAPSPVAVEAERALGLLEQRIGTAGA